jgi:hypothetical protein
MGNLNNNNKFKRVQGTSLYTETETGLTQTARASDRGALGTLG